MTDRDSAHRLETDESARRLLAIYLRDHSAGAAAGRRLANRLKGQNEDVGWMASVIHVAEEVAEDEATLNNLRGALSVHGGQIKRILAVTAEIVGRAKLNGRLARYSPLSRLLELETLMAGIQVKERLWVSLQRIDYDWTGLLPSSPADLERRAAEQIERLAEVHELAASAAFEPSQGASAG